MIVPSKGIAAEKALITVGADALAVLREPLTVSSLLDATRRYRTDLGRTDIAFDWFVLALDFLYSVGAIAIDSDGLLRRTK